MELLGKAARVSLAIPVESRLWRDDKTGTAKLPEPYLLEQIRRVLQPPKMRETFAGLKGKSDLSEKTDRVIYEKLCEDS